jgi:hypothetical protein
MKYTNNYNLPDFLVEGLLEDTYTKGDANASVTELLSPPQMRHLLLKHDDEITADVSTLIASAQGRSFHYMIEMMAKKNYNTLSEKIIYSNYLGWKIKGQFDLVLIGECALLDIKTCKAYKVDGGVVPKEWVHQTNIYKRILQKEKGMTINKIQIGAYIKDWSRHKAQSVSGYPPAEFFMMDVPVWEDDAIDALIEERVRLHQEEIPRSCTEEDIWAKPSVWAVMKRGKIKAVRLFSSLAEAEEFASASVGLYVEHRPGKAVRCSDWCNVAPFCQQWETDPRNIPAQPTMENLFDA